MHYIFEKGILDREGSASVLNHLLLLFFFFLNFELLSPVEPWPGGAAGTPAPTPSWSVSTALGVRQN